MAAIFLLVFGQITLPEVADAIVPKQEDDSLESLAFASEILQASPQSEALDDVRMTSAAAIVGTWESFRVAHGGWSAVIDQRTGRVESAEGEGIPFIPGRGNRLRMADISADLGNDRDIDLAQMEVITRAFLPRVTNLLGVDPSTLVLNQGRSGHPAEYLWFVDFDVTRDGLPIEGARVVFRVNNGNLIQFGSENLPAEGAAVPKVKVTRDQALTILADYIGGFSAADVFMDGGSQRLVPVKLADIRFAEGFERGKGRGLARVWQFAFRRNGNHGTWRARVDATSGKMLELRDLNDYASAQIAGGVTSLTGSETRPMPFADVSSGGYTNSAGVYDYTGGTVISALDGQYVKIIDSCGAISLASGSSGNLYFGTSSGADDCGTPGYGGAGNTNASRTQFYHLNRAKEIARGWLNLPWLTSQLTARVNLDGICNSFWDGASINFIRRGTGCSNAGQIQGVGLHEFGHGLDTNDGNGPSPDKGTGETYADWTAALITHDSCIGSGYLTSNCDGYGDACTSCTGVRDIDYAKHFSNTPHTVGNFTQVHCPVNNPYNGPCGREGHCESQVSSEALWDLAVRDLPNLGLSSDMAWAVIERLWYLSRSTATAAFTCFKAASPWSSDGCGTGSLWKTIRAVDDDDGNLLNGTPHSAALYAAFHRHGIACASDVGATTSFRGCTQQSAIPTLSLVASNNQVKLNWSGSSGVYDIYRNEQGCNGGGFIKVANDLTTSPFVDSTVANDFTYFYKVVAQPSSNEACPLAPSACLEANPCSPPAAPARLTATAASANQIDLSWTDSLGATRYHIYRRTGPYGPFIQIGTRSGTTFSDVGLALCTTYYYHVVAAQNDTCTAASAIQARATTTGNCLLTARPNGPSLGTVTSTPAGISCGSDCSESYLINTSVTLTVVPAPRYMLKYWTGACTEAGVGECTLRMTESHSVKAVFGKPLLTVEAHSPLSVSTFVIKSIPSGIECSRRSSSFLYCSDSYDYDALVTLEAVPGDGEVFSGWSGDCTGTGACSVIMKEDREVRANFALPKLFAWVPGKEGIVTASPAPLWNSSGAQDQCGSFCEYRYLHNTQVTLTAVPAAGAVFLGWGGSCAGTGNCTITMSGDHLVTATFSTSSLTELRVITAGAGLGRVTSTPSGTSNCPGCSQVYPYNTLVTIEAAPEAGSKFSGWSGECSGTGTCTVIMDRSRLVGATFSVATHTLGANVAGEGSGTLTSIPSGINCGEDCNEEYSYNSPVRLVPTPAVGSVFSGWGGACTGTGTCTVTMAQAQSVVATFSVAIHSLTTSLAGTGSGTVTSNPVGMSCGVDCSEAYSHDTQVTLTATPTTGSVFSGWSGACAGTGACVVTMTQARSVAATFSVATHALIVNLVGVGSGVVTSSPPGTNCGMDCSEAYNYNTQVTLTAVPSSALFIFKGWSGACTGTGSCIVTMDQAKSVTATFDDKGQDFYTVAPCRVYDTRVIGSPMTSEVPRIIQIAGACGVPVTAKAVSLNLTAIMAPGQGFITLYPGDISSPGTWTNSFRPLLNQANNAVMPLAWNGDGTLAALVVISGGGSMDMAVDVNGYYE